MEVIPVRHQGAPVEDLVIYLGQGHVRIDMSELSRPWVILKSDMLRELAHKADTMPHFNVYTMNYEPVIERDYGG